MCKRSSTACLLSSVDGPTLPSVATGTAALPLGTLEGLPQWRGRGCVLCARGVQAGARSSSSGSGSSSCTALVCLRPHRAAPVHWRSAQQRGGAAQPHAAAGWAVGARAAAAALLAGRRCRSCGWRGEGRAPWRQLKAQHCPACPASSPACARPLPNPYSAANHTLLPLPSPSPSTHPPRRTLQAPAAAAQAW